MKFPGVKIIDRYIMRKFIGTYVFAIALIIVIVVVFDAVEKMDDFIERKASVGDILFQYYMNFIPFFVNQFSGLFTFIAVIFFTSKMAYQTEIIAILSGGASFARLMWPYFLSSLIIASLSLALNLYIIPKASTPRIEFENTYLRSSNSLKADQHIYRQLSPGEFVYIRDYSPTKNTASFMALERYENSAIKESLEAKDLTFDPDALRWSAPVYVTRTFEGEDERYEVHGRLDTLINLTASELGRVADVIQMMDIAELSEFIRQQRDKGSDQIQLFEVERHKRFAGPVSTFILTLIGVSLSSRKVRGGTGLHIGIGIGLCFSYILFSKFAEEFAKGGVLPASLSVWLPNILFAAIAIYLYKKAPK